MLLAHLVQRKAVLLYNYILMFIIHVNNSSTSNLRGVKLPTQPQGEKVYMMRQLLLCDYMKLRVS